MMKKWIVLFIICLLTFGANSRTLKIGIPQFDPPYVMQLDRHHFDGFDIAMMDYICSKLRATCVYVVFKRDNLLQAVADHTVDLAFTNLAIVKSLEPSIYFSVPYLVQTTQIITLKKKVTSPFSIMALDNQNIGISDDVFIPQLKELNVRNPKVKFYLTDDQLIDALKMGDIQFALIDKHSANYWVGNSGGKIHNLGSPMIFETKLGIAISPRDRELVKKINEAILDYHKSGDFKEDYNKYLFYFER